MWCIFRPEVESREKRVLTRLQDLLRIVNDIYIWNGTSQFCSPYDLVP